MHHTTKGSNSSRTGLSIDYKIPMSRVDLSTNKEAILKAYKDVSDVNNAKINWYLFVCLIIVIIICQLFYLGGWVT